MNLDVDDMTSGRLMPETSTQYISTDAISDREEISSEGYSRLMRGVRYGRYFMFKGLKEQYVHDPVYHNLLRKEFEIMVQMDHPNIVRVYSFEEIEGMGICIVMEWIDGMPLDTWLATHPSAASRRRVVGQLLDAMKHWHSHQVVHRDLKPSNILVTRNGANVRVIDFGLADADQYAVLKEPAYTLSYASPEQLEGGELDCRSDIYSFGRLLRLIFPRRYRAVAARCCRHRREQRYPSAEAVYAALKRRMWLPIVAVVLLLAAMVGLWQVLFHFDSQQFSYTVGDNQVLQVKIVDSEAIVVGCDTVVGDLVLPDRVRHGLFCYPLREIGYRAFFQCKDLTKVSFPSTLRRIEDEAFASCINLGDTLLLTEDLEYLGDHVFDDCEQLKACRVESRRLHVKKDPDKYGRFGNNISMKDIIVDGNVDTLCEHLFEWAYWGVTDIWLEEGLTHLGERSLSELYNLERIHFPSTLKKIDQSCFYGCGIRRLIIPDQIEEIETYGIGVMFNCRYVEFGRGLKFLGPGNLYGYRNLDTVVFRSTEPPTVTATTFNFVQESPNPLVLVPAEALERYLADPNFAKLNIKGY